MQPLSRSNLALIVNHEVVAVPHLTGLVGRDDPQGLRADVAVPTPNPTAGAWGIPGVQTVVVTLSLLHAVMF